MTWRPAADVDAVRPAGVEVLDVRLPRGEDRRPDPGVRQRGQRREVHRGLGQPHRRRPASEPHLEVAGAPQDLRPPVVRGRERQDRVVEGLGDPGPAALAVGRREPREHLRRRRREVAGERRAHVPRDVGGRPALRDRAVALLGDPRVPVAERRGRGVLGHAARERVDPAGLVEVGVDNEPAARHRRSRGRGSRGRLRLLGRAVARDADRLAHREPASLARGEPQRPREQQAAALVDALEPGLRVRDGLDRAPPGVGRRLGRGARPRRPPSRCRSRSRRRPRPGRSRRGPIGRRRRRTTPTGCRRRPAGGPTARGRTGASIAASPSVVQLEVDDELGREAVAEEADRLADRDRLARDGAVCATARPGRGRRGRRRTRRPAGRPARSRPPSRTPRASCPARGTAPAPSAARGRRRTAAPRGRPP